MSIQLLLSLLQLRHDILVSADEIWWSSHGPDRRIERAMQRHRAGLALLIAWSDIHTCPARDLHRRYWTYTGGRFVCEKCEELLPCVS